MMRDATVHASAVLVGDIAVLIRGPSGSGKSRLAFDLILAGRAAQIPAAILIGDDRVRLRTQGQSAIVQPAEELEGLIEIRGLGIRRCDFARQGPVGLVVDLGATDAARMPDASALATVICGISVLRVPVKTGEPALPLVFGALLTQPYGES